MKIRKNRKYILALFLMVPFFQNCSPNYMKSQLPPSNGDQGTFDTGKVPPILPPTTSQSCSLGTANIPHGSSVTAYLV